VGTVLKVTLGVVLGGMVLIIGCSALLTAGSEDVGDEGSDEAAKVKVERTRLIYQPDQTGGRFHAAFVIVRNPSSEPVDVSGQVSVKENGRLIKSFEPTATILPRSRGILMDDALDLPQAVRRGKLETQLVSTRSTEADSAPEVKISKLRYSKDEIASCKISGTVAHNGKETFEIRVNAIGYQGPRIVSGGFTFVEKVFPNSPATFDVDIASTALCPDQLDRMEAFWEPGPGGLSG